MRLKEIDWNAKGGPAEIEIDYPDHLVQEFVNWVRMTKAWPEAPQMMEQRVRRLNGALADYRNQPRTATETAAAGPTTRTVVPDAKTQAMVERLRKAREAKRAKRAALSA